MRPSSVGDLSWLDGILSSPFPGRSLVSGAVRLVDVRNLRYKWVIRVGVGKHGADGEENFKSPS